ncbi:hypothetical protein PCANC_18891 [Puccinia coronata f. sp. avenae]|uniref:Uncharacterized protein n=1 Tax=Puccinia coronata f. sp. avenae TaxID=200324 RepID=A0A2N5SNJ7_9BASI|nr:hypothetical protein PCANC_18891 [Puccinia coronata f. sp. avenae]
MNSRGAFPPLWDDSSQATVPEFPYNIANVLDNRQTDGYLPTKEWMGQQPSSLTIESEHRYHDHCPEKRLKMMPENGTGSWTASKVTPENVDYQSFGMHTSPVPGFAHGALDEQARFYPQRDLSPLKAPSYTTLLPLPESFIKASNLLLNSVPSYEFASTSSQNHSSLPEISGMNQLPTDSQLSASHYHGNLN